MAEGSQPKKPGETTSKGRSARRGVSAVPPGPPGPAPRPWTRRLARLLGWGALGAGVVSLAGGAALAVAYQRYVVSEPGDPLSREHILSIIAQESPVYYRDGKTRIGVFFEAEHRQYLGWEELPSEWVVSIVAAEDDGFWSHPGVDVWGLGRAVKDNLVAGEVVAGGSTLTQQTAKNLYYRPDRSFRAKGLELLNALRLEAHYDKREILTFYANQFHVTGNGRGLAIGARHFFDKDVEELTLAESAFLAGLVKAPSRYDPFLGDDARRAVAVERAHERTRYVLRRLAEVPAKDLVPARGKASGREELDLAEVRALQAEAERLLAEGFTLDFTKGTFRYDSSAVLDEVARRLAEPPFDTVLEANGIDDPATAGLVVVTTLDADAQVHATYGLWHHLTEIGAWLEAPSPEAWILTDHRGPTWDPELPVRAHEFRVARVTEHVTEGKKHLKVDLGGRACVVDRDGVTRAAVATLRGQKGDKNAKASGEQVDAFADGLADGAVVMVSVREVPPSGDPTCDLELRPALQGAVMVLENGQIRAMVGGNDNRNFNRATALRQMGSTWKPLVYHAALQLGWQPDDVLDNGRGVFPFSTTFYYPRPDHDPVPEVSMSWAGVNSENLASVWLLYHLVDKLDGEGVRALAESLGLGRRDDETPEAYKLRIQKAGVLPTPQRLREAWFLQARQEALVGLAETGFASDERALISMLYGWGFDAERERVAREGSSSAWKQAALDHSWRAYEPRIEDCAVQHAVLEAALDQEAVPPQPAIPDLSVLVEGRQIRVACGTVPAGYVRPDDAFLYALVVGAPTQDEAPVDEEAEERPRGLGGLFNRREPGEGPRLGNPFRRFPRVVGVDEVWVDGRIHLGTLQQLGDGMARRAVSAELSEEPVDLYDPDVLYWHQDFRVLVALEYLSALAEGYGVQTDLHEVLSMPLGASDVTLEEMTSVYEGITSGQRWTFPGRAGGRAVDSPPSSTLLIAEIRDVDGNVLYKAQPEPRRVATRESAHLTADILRNVVRFGTGQRAGDAVQLGGARVPLMGKTGTTNDFKNVAFVGVAPVWTGEGFGIDDGFVVGAYVGYDDNHPMTHKGIRLAGASGALPAWIGAVQGLAREGLLGEPSGDVPENGTWPLSVADGLVHLPVDPATGLALAEAESLDPTAPTVLVERRPEHEAPEFERVDRPPRVAPRTEDVDEILRRPHELIWP